MAKAAKCGVPTPEVYALEAKQGLLVMEYIDGKTAKQSIIDNETDLDALGQSIGRLVAKLHSNEIIHGDLTTSNMLLKQNQCVFIDFGLANISSSVEDRAVDLYVLERAILSTHPEIGTTLFGKILASYSAAVTNDKATLSKLAEVQLRGRKRDMIG